MTIQVRNETKDFNGYRASRVKSLFNAERGDKFVLDAVLPIEDLDRGDIAYQDWCFIEPGLKLKNPAQAAKQLWKDTLLDMGVKLLSKAICDIQRGKVIREPQQERFATFEPSTEVEPIFRPDLLMLNANN